MAWSGSPPRLESVAGALSRRSLITGAATSALAANLPASAGAAEGDRVKLSAALRLGDKDFDFREEGGIDRGVFVGEFVRQRSVEARNSDLPLFTVHFRSDPNNPTREEVVVELGRCWVSKETAADLMTPYTMTILRGDSTVAKIDVPYHWWRARWRWQSAPRPVVRSPALLRQRGWVPPLGKPTVGLSEPSPATRYNGPMSTGGIETAMAMAGDRVEIGVVTEAQADFLITGSAAALETVLAWGEACGTMPMHIRDEKTGSQLDLLQYPKLGILSWNPGDPTAPSSSTPLAKDAKGNEDPRYFRLDSAHTPAAAALPFMLTDDPYYLEELEAQGFYGFAWAPSYRANANVPFLVFPEEDRSTAWSMRNLFQLAALAPEKPPAWLKSRAYWQKSVDENLGWLERFMASPARLHRVFRMCPRSDIGDSWMRAFLCCSVAQGILMGQKAWTPFFRWIVETHIVMTTGKDGWNRQYPAPYEFFPLKTWKKNQFVKLVTDTSLDNETWKTWGEVFDDVVRGRVESVQKYPNVHENWDIQSWDGHSLMNPPENSIQYFAQIRAALVMAMRLGIGEAKPGLDYLKSEISPLAEKLKTGAGYRWAYTV